MSQGAPPGGGPNATVIASTQPPVVPTTTPADDPTKLQPQPVVTPTTTPDPLSLEPAVTPVTTTAAEPKDIGDLGDHGLNIAADFFVNTLGLDLDGRELTEASKGNFHLLEAKIEVLGDKAKGAGPMLALAKESISRLQGAEKDRLTKTTAMVHEAVGGEANWKAVQQYARTNLPADQLKQASEGLSQGGFVAVAVAKQLLSLASTHPQVSVQGQPATNVEGVSASLQGVAPLNRQQYRVEYRKLVEKYGITGAAKSDELKALNARVTH